jgi:hypothetical protein
MASSTVSMLDTRNAPFDFSNIPGFPNPMTGAGVWGDCLPRFIEANDDNLAKHLMGFHLCMHQLSIFQEDVLMKMLLTYLEEDAQIWYRYLLVVCIHSLKDFHRLFHSRYKRRYPIEIIFENYCNEVFKSVIEHIEDSSCSSEVEKEFTDDEFK